MKINLNKLISIESNLANNDISRNTIQQMVDFILNFGDRNLNISHIKNTLQYKTLKELGIIEEDNDEPKKCEPLNS